MSRGHAQQRELHEQRNAPARQSHGSAGAGDAAGANAGSGRRTAAAGAPAHAAASNATATRSRNFSGSVIPVVFGLALFVAVWAMWRKAARCPARSKTWHSAVEVFSDPFYSKGPTIRASAGTS